MSNIKQYKLTSFDDFTVVIEIDHDKCTEELLTEINNFWSGHEDRLNEADGNLLHAVLGIIYRRTWWTLAEMGGLAWVDDMVKEFGKMEGWPPMDGSFGIKFVSFDDVEFDHTPRIEEVVI